MGIRFGRLALAAAFTLVASSALLASTVRRAVTLNAVDRPGGAVLNEPVQWRILRLDSHGQARGDAVGGRIEAVLKAELKPGHYMIEAIRGTVHIKQGLVVGSGAETRNIVVSPRTRRSAALPRPIWPRPAALRRLPWCSRSSHQEGYRPDCGRLRRRSS